MYHRLPVCLQHVSPSYIVHHIRRTILAFFIVVASSQICPLYFSDCKSTNFFGITGCFILILSCFNEVYMFFVRANMFFPYLCRDNPRKIWTFYTTIKS